MGDEVVLGERGKKAREFRGGHVQVRGDWLHGLTGAGQWWPRGGWVLSRPGVKRPLCLRGGDWVQPGPQHSRGLIHQACNQRNFGCFPSQLQAWLLGSLR